jgi:hypothetical protein
MAPSLLELLGLPALTVERDPGAHAEFLRLAIRLRSSGRRVVGFFPAEPAVGVSPAMIHTVLAFANLGATPVAAIDANLLEPAFTERLPPATGDKSRGFTPVQLPVDPPVEATLLVPTAAVAPPLPRVELARVVSEQRDRCAHVIVDLTGFERAGEHLFAFDLVDGVVLIARAGTSEYQLISAQRQVPPERRLGAMLVG